MDAYFSVFVPVAFSLCIRMVVLQMFTIGKLCLLSKIVAFIFLGISPYISLPFTGVLSLLLLFFVLKKWLNKVEYLPILIVFLISIPLYSLLWKLLKWTLPTIS